jgi:hypothetical protein
MNTRAYSLTFVSAGLMALVGLAAAAESKEYLKGTVHSSAAVRRR